MDHHGLQHRFAALTTAHLADACVRAGVPVRCAPAQLGAGILTALVGTPYFVWLLLRSPQTSR